MSTQATVKQSTKRPVRGAKTKPPKTQTDHLPVPVKEKFPEELIWLPAKERPPFPGVIASTLVQEAPFIKGAEAILKQREPYFATSYLKDENSQDNFYNIGCIARVLKSARTNDANIAEPMEHSVFISETNTEHGGKLQGFLYRALRRIKIESVVARTPYLRVRVRYFKEDAEGVFGLKDAEINSYLSLIISKVKELIRLDSVFVEEMKLFISQHALSSPLLFINLISGHLTAPSPKELQELLAVRGLKERMLRMIYYLQKEVEIFELRKKIDTQVQKEVSKQQRQFFLREQLKYIKKELGIESDEKTLVLEEFTQKAATLKLSARAQQVVTEECRKLSLYDSRSPEYSLVRSYVEWILGMPWTVPELTLPPLVKLAKVLERHHYGMMKVKERILEFMAVEKLKGATRGSILCFLGPPGVGKTSLGKSIAEATGRKFYRFSLGGMRDEAELKGHRRTYVGAMPGKFIQALKVVGTLHPVIMLDEVDKMASGFRGDPASVLLEVLDKEQNQQFLDHYLDVPVDLSKVLFITTANQIETIPLPLLDRMEVVELSGYVPAEKAMIAKRHLLPKLAAEHGVRHGVINIETAALHQLISSYARESGVRSLEKSLAKIFRKAIYTQQLTKETKETAAKKQRPRTKRRSPTFKNVTIKRDDLKRYLGLELFREERLNTVAIPGVVCGLAWTQLGGTELYVEAAVVRAQEKGESMRLTGNLGDVMLESAELAYSYVRSYLAAMLSAERYKAFFEQEIHIHVPAGATPKDGPSAGVTMATAILSVLSGNVVPQQTAMTGELTLTGQVLPVGGIREKVVAAKRSCKRKLYLPTGNREDFMEIPASIRRGLQVTFIDEFPALAKALFTKAAFKKLSKS